MTDPILQTRLPFAIWMDPRTARLPGIQPVQGDDWLRVDEAYAPQMAERDRLIASRPEIVHALMERGRPAADELYAAVLDWTARTPGFAREGQAVRRPDGVLVPLDPEQPLLTLGRLVQEDLCLLEAEGEEHVLTGAILCFPASWWLTEKLGRPLTGIHVPVPSYDGDLARRVQRLFDAIRVGQPLWRGNALIYRDPTLHQPRREADPRTDRTGGSYVRSERQVLMRLPQSQAVVFSIHTWVVPVQALEPAELAALRAAAH